MGDISIRDHIRWLPDPASESTSTVVLTSPKRRFVDLRIFLDPKPSSDGILPSSSLDWAIAGTSSSIQRIGSDGRTHISHSKWTHWIDSRTAAHAESVVDEGDMFPQPDGITTLERGRMVNPATGRETEYEELWREEAVQAVPVLGGDSQVICVVLELRAGDGTRGMVVRLGQYCQALVRKGDAVMVERMKWDDGVGTWVRLVKIGDGEAPSDWAAYFGHEAVVEDQVKVGVDVWMVVERS